MCSNLNTLILFKLASTHTSCKKEIFFIKICSDNITYYFCISSALIVSQKTKRIFKKVNICDINITDISNQFRD